MRVHLPEWSGQKQRDVEVRLRRMPGVRGAQADPLTGNVLVRFDPAATDNETIIAFLRKPTGRRRKFPPTGKVSGGRHDHAPARPAVLREGRGADDETGRARITVPGLDRDPDLARRVVERLQSRPEVRASASALTGRVLVEWNRHKIELEELLDDISELAQPSLPHEQTPAHPLDPEPLRQSAAGTISAAIGLTLLGVRQALGIRRPLVNSIIPVEAAGLIGIVHAFPVVTTMPKNATVRACGRLLDRNAIR